MIKIVIVDDSEKFSEEVYKVVKEYFVDKRLEVLIHTYTKSEMLLYDLEEKIIYDIYFLDIEMPQISGLELAKEIRKIDEKAIIVFITSYLKYSIVGYELGIFRYIPKTNFESKLILALESATDELSKITNQIYIVSTPTRYEKIKYNDILYIYKDRKYSVLCCCNGIYKVRRSLKQVSEELKDAGQKQFVFIERGYIANIIHISKVQSGEVIMQNGEVLHIGRSYYSLIKQEIAEFWSDK